jgi:short-subunit dehydrogenase
MNPVRMALITGASRDVGIAIAVRLAKSGVAIVGSGRSEPGLQRLKAAVEPLSR